MSEPATWLHEVRTRTENAILQRGVEEFQEGLRLACQSLVTRIGREYFVDAVDDALLEAVGRIEVEAAQDSRYSLLLDLARRAHDRAPLAPLLAFTLGSYTEKQEAWLYSMGPVHELLDADRGERRARGLKHALHDILETTYEPYLKGIIILANFSAGCPFRVPSSTLGVLVKQAVAALKRVEDGEQFATLVDPDAGWLRNATSHRGHLYWRYLPVSDELAVHDRSREPTVFSVDDLLDRAFSLWRLSGPTFNHVVTTYLFRDFLVGTGLSRKMSAILMHWAMGEDEQATAAAQDFQALAATVLEPLGTWGQQRGRT